jgi:cupin fold WbuC family metalloprotein
MVQGSWFKVQGVQEPKAELVERIELSPNGQVVALNIPAGQWHTLRSLESGSVILEVKDGKFEPLQDCDVLK